ncbi:MULTISPECIES: hypothetical protein [unclassified Microcoleus]|uniref:hypothetical protein n=1 Tax=unclassified Microcoleus TaxID=2642155 RepID=UPI002FCE7BEE
MQPSARNWSFEAGGRRQEAEGKRKKERGRRKEEEGRSQKKEGARRSIFTNMRCSQNLRLLQGLLYIGNASETALP